LKKRVQLVVLAVAAILVSPWVAAAGLCSQQETSREQCPNDCPMQCPEQEPSAPVRVSCCEAAPAEPAIPASVPRLQSSNVVLELNTAEVLPGVVAPAEMVSFAIPAEIGLQVSPSPQAMLCIFLI
jgi:hypothetical protein